MFSFQNFRVFFEFDMKPQSFLTRQVMIALRFFGEFEVLL